MVHGRLSSRGSRFAFCSRFVARRRVVALPSRRRRRRPRRARGRMSSSSPPIASKGARRALPASGWPATTSPCSSRASAPSRCPATRTCFSPSSSRRAAATADRRSRFTARWRTTPQTSANGRRGAGAGALLLGRCAGEGTGGVRRLRAGRAGLAELRLRQLRRPRREGQDRARPPLLPRGCRRADQGRARPLLGPPLQGACGAAARRERAADRHRPALAECRRDAANELRHRALGLRHSRGQHQRRGGERALRGRGQDARSGAAGARFGQSARRRLRAACDGRSDDESCSRKADGAERRRLPAGECANP